LIDGYYRQEEKVTMSGSPSFFFKSREAIDGETEEKQGRRKKLHLKHLHTTPSKIKAIYSCLIHKRT